MTDLKNRVRIGTSVDIQTYNALKKLSAQTQIPMSRLLDKAIELVLKEYGKLVK